MTYLHDTGPLAAILRGRPAAIALIDPWKENDEVSTSIVVYGEVVEYIKGHPNFLVHYHNLHTLLTQITPRPLTYPILDRYADIRRSLRPPHGPGLIGDVDTLIAATALEYDLTIVTMDSHFTRVPDLRVQTVSFR